MGITCPQSQLEARLLFCPVFLETTQKLVLFAVGKRQIVVSQLTIFCLSLPFISFQFPFICSFITQTIRVSHGGRS